MGDVEDAFKSTTLIDVPEAVGAFDLFEDLQQAFFNVRTVGFSRSDISLLGQEDVLEEKLSRSYWLAEEVKDEPRAPEAIFVSEEAIGVLNGSMGRARYRALRSRSLPPTVVMTWRARTRRLTRNSADIWDAPTLQPRGKSFGRLKGMTIQSGVLVRARRR